MKKVRSVRFVRFIIQLDPKANQKAFEGSVEI